MPRPTADVDASLDARSHPLRGLIDDIRSAVLAADPRVTEEWKWNAPSFSVGGAYLLTLMLRDDDAVLLVVHHPAAPGVETVLLTAATADGRRMLTFRTTEEFAAARGEFDRVLAELVAHTA